MKNWDPIFSKVKAAFVVVLATVLTGVIDALTSLDLDQFGAWSFLVGAAVAALVALLKKERAVIYSVPPEQPVEVDAP